MRLLIALALGVLAALGTTSHAHAAPHDPGTHFLAEVDGGVLLTGDGGPALRAALGAGFKLHRTPLRLYLIGQFGVSSYVAEPSPVVAASGRTEQGAFEDFGLGPRLLLPVYGPVRVYAECVVGTSLASARQVAADRPDLYARQWLGLVQLSSGLQWRVLYPLSLGIRFSAAWNADGLAGAARYAGVRDDLRLSLTAGGTWHF